MYGIYCTTHAYACADHDSTYGHNVMSVLAKIGFTATAYSIPCMNTVCRETVHPTCGNLQQLGLLGEFLPLKSDSPPKIVRD